MWLSYSLYRLLITFFHVFFFPSTMAPQWKDIKQEKLFLTFIIRSDRGVDLEIEADRPTLKNTSRAMVSLVLSWDLLQETRDKLKLQLSQLLQSLPFLLLI